MNPVQKITVAHVMFESRLGGAHRRILTAAPKLDSKGISTQLILPNRPGNAAQKAAELGVPCHTIRIQKIPSPRNPLQILAWLVSQPIEILQFVKLFRRLGPDIVNVCGAFFISAAIAARICGLPLVWHLNDTIVPYPLSHLLGRLVRKLSDRAVAQGHAVANYYGLSPGDYECLYSGVDTSLFQPRGKSRDLPDDGSKVTRVGIIGNWNPIKGLETFVEAAGQVDTASDGQVEFIMAGARLATQKAYTARINAMIQQLDMKRRLVLRDYVDDVPAMISDLDIVVMSSIKEGCPNVVLEAMATGKPVIASNVGCVTELVSPGLPDAAGIVIPVNDASALAKGILQLHRDPCLRQSMGYNGRTRAEALFSIEKYVDGHGKLYRSILADRNSRPGA
jgi:glycosyltransferase involved in cell wall biosynthesis